MAKRYCQFLKYIQRPVSEMKAGCDNGQPCRKSNKVSNYLTSRVLTMPLDSFTVSHSKDQDLYLYINQNISILPHYVQQKIFVLFSIMNVKASIARNVFRTKIYFPKSLITLILK